MKIAVCYSGGMDSRILYQFAKVGYGEENVTAVYWDHGHKAREDEIARLPKFVRVRKVDWLNLPAIDGGYLAKKTEPASGAMYIPGRNLVFAVLTACQELADEVWLGNVFEENHSNATDKNDIFSALTSATLSYVLSPFKPNVKVRSPFVDHQMGKFECVQWALQQGLSQAEIKSTYSCYNLESAKHGRKCGHCKQCVRRFLIFGKLGFDELEQLETHPLRAKESRDWIINIINAMEACDWSYPLRAEVPNYFDYLLPAVQKYAPSDELLLSAATIAYNRLLTIEHNRLRPC